MDKLLAAGICLLAFTTGASAQIIPENITVDVNLNLKGLFEQEKEDSNQTNNTYGENIGGQSVYTEKKPNKPDEQRNTNDMKVTNDEVAAAENPIISFLKNMF